jgi:hypothetical protein
MYYINLKKGRLIFLRHIVRSLGDFFTKVIRSHCPTQTTLKRVRFSRALSRFAGYYFCLGNHRKIFGFLIFWLFSFSSTSSKQLHVLNSDCPSQINSDSLSQIHSDSSSETILILRVKKF